ncbi:MAG: hypothetical protein KGY80_09465 [Candidatus Thorarchaeota archaeon]|nr:hypothetical protein [Candidatus Thorarchaeota archaeon]
MLGLPRDVAQIRGKQNEIRGLRMCDSSSNVLQPDRLFDKDARPYIAFSTNKNACNYYIVGPTLVDDLENLRRDVDQYKV